jgi:hypothetical protein
MVQRQERRKHRRIGIRLPLECTATMGDRQVTCRTVTHDISSGGLCFEAESDEFPLSATFNLELGIPPGDGHSPYPGRVRGTGQVVRVEQVRESGSPTRFRIAAQFNKPLKLVF